MTKMGLALALPFISVFMACAPKLTAPGPDGSIARKEDNKMTDAKISLNLSRSTVVYGESMPVQVQVENVGANTLSIPAGIVSPLRYELRSGDEERDPIHLSEASYFASRVSGLPPLAKEHEDLAPGKTHIFRGDPALCSAGALTPGCYELVASVPVDRGVATCPPVEVTVTPARVHAYAATYCPFGGTSALVFDHVDKEDRPWLFLREPRRVELELGIAHRVPALDVPGPIDDVAVSVRGSSIGGARWLTWLQGGCLGVQPMLGTSPVGGPKSTAVNLGNAQIVRPAMELQGGSLLVLVTGTRDGEAIAQPYTIATTGMTPGDPVRLGMAAVPRHTTATYVRNTDGGDHVWLTWVDEDPSGSTLRALSLDTGGRANTADAMILYRHRGRVQACAIQPFAEGGDPLRVTAVFGPERIEGHPPKILFRLVRASVSATPAVDDSTRIEPPSSSVNAWSVSHQEDGVVLAASEETIWIRNSRGDRDWERLVSDGQVRNVGLLDASSGYWAVLWLDSRYGLRMAPNPHFQLGRG